MDGSRGGQGVRTSLLENHKWFKVSLEILVPLEKQFDSFRPLFSSYFSLDLRAIYDLEESNFEQISSVKQTKCLLQGLN